MILCDRKNEGIEVELVKTETEPVQLYVYVSDKKNNTRFRLEALDGKEAMDMFQHPFAYYGLDFRTVHLDSGGD